MVVSDGILKLYQLGLRKIVMYLPNREDRMNGEFGGTDLNLVWM